MKFCKTRLALACGAIALAQDARLIGCNFSDDHHDGNK
jgi:hypothetical protein